MSAKQIHDVDAVIISLTNIRGNLYTMSLRAPAIAETAKPMQFVNIALGDLSDPLLRRPFSLSGIYPDSGVIGITWAVVGRGTQIMARWQAGESVRVLGPLGNGLDIDELDTSQGLLLVAGGTGLAPMIPLVSRALAKDAEVHIFYGARSADDLLDMGGGCRVHLATEDGSIGFKGLVTGLLESSWMGALGDSKPTVISCGPRPMLSAVKRICRRHRLPLLVSLEERMACGYGVCQGCAVPSARGGYHRVCTEGPVFWADRLDHGECTR